MGPLLNDVTHRGGTPPPAANDAGAPNAPTIFMFLIHKRLAILEIILNARSPLRTPPFFAPSGHKP